jgi:ankyrin repeat protein
MTTIIKAAGDGDLNKVKHLIDQGANVNVHDKSGNTALIMASAQQHLNVVKYLIQRGASVNARNENGGTAVIFASNDVFGGDGNIATLKYLIERGALINARDTTRGTALLVAAGRGNLNKVKLLVKHGAVSVKTTYGATPLSFAYENDHLDIVNYLSSLKIQQMHKSRKSRKTTKKIVRARTTDRVYNIKKKNSSKKVFGYDISRYISSFVI